MTVRPLKISAAALMRIAFRFPVFHATKAHTTDTIPITTPSSVIANGGSSAPQSMMGNRNGILPRPMRADRARPARTVAVGVASVVR